jgi:hypothetical protein
VIKFENNRGDETTNLACYLKVTDRIASISLRTVCQITFLSSEIRRYDRPRTIRAIIKIIFIPAVGELASSVVKTTLMFTPVGGFLFVVFGDGFLSADQFAMQLRRGRFRAGHLVPRLIRCGCPFRFNKISGF